MSSVDAGDDERRSADVTKDDVAPAPVERSPLGHLRALGPVLSLVRGRLVVVGLLTVVGGLAEAGALIVVAELAVTITGDGGDGQLSLGPLEVDLGSSVGSMILVAVGLVVLRLSAQLVATLLTARSLADIQEKLRSDAFRAFLRSDWETQSAEPDGYLQELATIYIARTSSSVQILTSAMAFAVNFAAMMVGALLLAPATALIILACVGVLFVVFRPLSTWVRNVSAQRAEEGREFARLITESVGHALEIRTTNVEDAVATDIERRASSLRRLEIRTDLLNLSLSPLYQSL
ncbi:MAG: ABC transporter transmembrane domain-containing protein, partial [Actinomycetota bacterium]